MGRKSNEKANTALDAQSGIATSLQKQGEKLVTDSNPAIDAARASYMGISKGNVPGIEKYVAPGTNAATAQFQMARKAAENMPPGAQRDAALRDIAAQEAAVKTGIYSGGVADATSSLGTMGMTGAATGLGAQAQAASAQGQVGQTYNNMATQKMGVVSDQAVAAGNAVSSIM